MRVDLEVLFSANNLLYGIFVLTFITVILQFKTLRVLVKAGMMSQREYSDLLSSILGYIFMLIRILNDKNIITKDEYIKLIALKLIMLRYPNLAPEILRKIVDGFTTR